MPVQASEPAQVPVVLRPPDRSPSPSASAERAPLRQCRHHHQRHPRELAARPLAPSQQPPPPAQACSHRAVSQCPLIYPRRLHASIRAAGRCHAALQPPHSAPAPPPKAPRSHRAVSNRRPIYSRCAPAATLTAGRCRAASQPAHRAQLSMPSASAAASAQRLMLRVAPAEPRAATPCAAARAVWPARLALARSMRRVWASSRQAVSCARLDRVAMMLPSTPTVAVPSHAAVVSRASRRPRRRQGTAPLSVSLPRCGGPGCECDCGPARAPRQRSAEEVPPMASRLRPRPRVRAWARLLPSARAARREVSRRATSARSAPAPLPRPALVPRSSTACRVRRPSPS